VSSLETSSIVHVPALIVPIGIAPSDDPLLSARSAAYSRSFTLRAGEQAEKPECDHAADAQAGGKS